MDTMKVTAAEVAKNFGQFADLALTEPVAITKHGREHLVLMSAKEFERLMSRDRRVYRAHEVPDEILNAIEQAEPAPECAEVERQLIQQTR